MEADDKDISDAKGRRPERAAAAEYQLGDLGIGGLASHVELDELLALGDPQLTCAAGLAEGLFFVQLDLVGQDELRLLDVLGSQELLGTGAARSALSVIIPVDIDGHTNPSCCPGALS